MVVIRVADRSIIYHACTLGLGPGPMGPALVVVIRVADRSTIYHACTLGLGPWAQHSWLGLGSMIALLYILHVL